MRRTIVATLVGAALSLPAAAMAMPNTTTPSPKRSQEAPFGRVQTGSLTPRVGRAHGVRRAR